MDGQFTTSPSFIPKQPLATRAGSGVSFHGVFWFVSIVILIISVFAWAGAYFYEPSVVASTELLKQSLAKAQVAKSLNQASVDRLFDFDSKVKIAKDLLYLDPVNNPGDTTQHVTLLPLFGLLESNTLKTIRFKDFKFTNIDNKNIQITMSGEAKGYPSISIQAKTFRDTGELSNIVFTDLNYGANGNVVFNMTANINPDLVSYANMVRSLGK